MDPYDKSWRQLLEMMERQSRLFADAIPKDFVRQAEQTAEAVRSLGLDRYVQSFEALGHVEDLDRMAREASSIFDSYQAALSSASAPWREMSESCQSALESVQEQLKLSGLQGTLDSMVEAFSQLNTLSWPIESYALDESTRTALESMQHSLEQSGLLLEELGLGAKQLEEHRVLLEPVPPASAIMSTPPPAVEPTPLWTHQQLREIHGPRELTLAKLCLRLKMWPEAESHARRATEWLEDSAEPFIGLGIALNAQGRHDEAIEAFQEAERRDPDWYSTRPDIRSVYEASFQRRRWDGQIVEHGEEES